jgi:hypothetical protein
VSFAISFQLQGDKELVNLLRVRAPKIAREKMLLGIRNTVKAVHSEALRSIQTIKGSREVTRYKPKRQHIVSPAGEAPNADRGGLAQSIFFDVDDARMTGSVGSKLNYAFWLEYGTKDMDERPWLHPAIKRVLGYAKSFFKFNAGDFK